MLNLADACPDGGGIGYDQSKLSSADSCVYLDYVSRCKDYANEYYLIA